MSLLEIHNLKVDYKRPDGTRLNVLNIPEFKLEADSQVCIKGHSGSGKTTLLNIIAGILSPTAGSIKLDGNELETLKETGRDTLRGRLIGFVFQTFNLLSGFTAFENVILGSIFVGGMDQNRSAIKERALMLLNKVGLSNHIHHRPSMLSSGEQQRVAIARALMNQPKLVLADEPTGSLDEKNSAEVLDLILDLTSSLKAALLLVTHDPAVMGRFSKVINLKDL